MIYEITPPGKPKKLPPERIATIDGKVVEATLEVRWTLNREVYFVKSILENRGATVVAISPFCTFRDL